MTCPSPDRVRSKSRGDDREREQHPASTEVADQVERGCSAARRAGPSRRPRIPGQREVVEGRARPRFAEGGAVLGRSRSCGCRFSAGLRAAASRRGPMPRRSATPGRNPSMSTSARATRSRTTAGPWGLLQVERDRTDGPGVMMFGVLRVVVRAGRPRRPGRPGSTSAPKSASHHGAHRRRAHAADLDDAYGRRAARPRGVSGPPRPVCAHGAKHSNDRPLPREGFEASPEHLYGARGDAYELGPAPRRRGGRPGGSSLTFRRRAGSAPDRARRR